MKIAIKNRKDGSWKTMSNGNGDENCYTRDLLCHIPELIPIEDLIPGESKLKFCIQNLPNSNSEDGKSIIGVDSKGKITIVGCKLNNDPSSGRDILGSAMDCAMRLWEMSYEDFNKMVYDSEGKSLVEIMREGVPPDEWSEEKFKKTVGYALQQGKFRLIVVIRQMTDEMKRTIRFLNARGPFSFETYAVELQYFSDEQVDIIIPRVVNLVEADQEVTEAAHPQASTSLEQAATKHHTQPAPSPEPSGIRHTAPAAASVSSGHTTTRQPIQISVSDRTVIRQPAPAVAPASSGSAAAKGIAQSHSSSGAISAEPKEAIIFFARCQESLSKDAIEIVRRLYNFSKETADNIMWWGRAFNFALNKESVELTVFSLSADGKLMFPPGDWQSVPLFNTLLPKFIDTLKAIPTLREQKEDFTNWPEFKVEELFANPENLKVFQESIISLKRELKMVTV